MNEGNNQVPPLNTGDSLTNLREQQQESIVELQNLVTSIIQVSPRDQLGQQQAQQQVQSSQPQQQVELQPLRQQRQQPQQVQQPSQQQQLLQPQGPQPGLPQGPQPHTLRDAGKHLKFATVDLQPSDILDCGEALFNEDGGKLREQMMFQTIPTEEDMDNIFGHVAVGAIPEQIKSTSHFKATQYICNQNQAQWDQYAIENQVYTVDLTLSGCEQFLYYLIMTVSVLFSGPFTAIFFFILPQLYSVADDTGAGKPTPQVFRTEWKWLRFEGKWVPTILFLGTTVLWSVGWGPYLLTYSIKRVYPAFAYSFHDSDIIQGLTRYAMIGSLLALQDQLFSIRRFCKDSEMRQESWQFDQWKHQFSIDDGTFEFTLIDAEGDPNAGGDQLIGNDQENQQLVAPPPSAININGCNMLPHIKDNLWKSRVTCFSRIIPFVFMILYASNAQDAGPCRQRFDDTKGYYNTSDANGKIKGFIEMSAFGVDWKAHILNILGYYLEFVYIKQLYDILFQTIVLHKTFSAYLIALINMQDIHATPRQLDEFYTLTQQERYYKRPAPTTFSSKTQADTGVEKDDYGRNIQYSDDVTKEIKNLWWKGESCYLFLYYYSQYLENKPINTKITTPLDMSNQKNLQNLIYLRALAFSIYKEQCTKAQNIVIFMIVVFGGIGYVIFTSQFTTTSSFAWLYGKYYPKAIWYYGIFFNAFYLVPICFTFFEIFYYEVKINQYFVNQASLWQEHITMYTRLNTLANHYFKDTLAPITDANGDIQVDEDGNPKTQVVGFEALQNTLVVLRVANKQLDDNIEIQDLNSQDNLNINNEEKAYLWKQTEDAFYPKVQSQRQAIKSRAFFQESDNGKLAFLIKRLVDDHGADEKVGPMLSAQSSSFNDALSDLNNTVADQQFYLFDLFAINYTFFTTMAALVFWYAIQFLQSTISASISQLPAA